MTKCILIAMKYLTNTFFSRINETSLDFNRKHSNTLLAIMHIGNNRRVYLIIRCSNETGQNATVKIF